MRRRGCLIIGLARVGPVMAGAITPHVRTCVLCAHDHAHGSRGGGGAAAFARNCGHKVRSGALRAGAVLADSNFSRGACGCVGMACAGIAPCSTTQRGPFIAEQSMFLVSGILLWLSAFGGATHSASRRAQGVVGLLLTSMHMTLLGALLALAQRNLYSHGVLEAGSLDDQHLGGAIMLVIGGVSYLAGGLWLTAELMRERILESGEPT